MTIVNPNGDFIKPEKKEETREVHNPRERIILWLIVAVLLIILTVVINTL